jgi:hypothetical protein
LLRKHPYPKGNQLQRPQSNYMEAVTCDWKHSAYHLGSLSGLEHTGTKVLSHPDIDQA